MNRYYYLIASLPALYSSQHILEVDYEQIVATIIRNLAPPHQKLLAYLMYPNDNRNLVRSIIEKTSGQPSDTFFYLSAFSKSTISDFQKNKSSLPKYMASFIDTYHENFATMSERELEDKLTHYFYEETKDVQDHFIVQYFQFEKELKSLITAYNHVLYGQKMADDMLGGDLIPKLIKKHEHESTLSKTYPYLMTLIKAIESKDPEHLETTIDQIKWAAIDRITGLSFFTHQNVFAYLLKLNMVRRWTKLTATTGRKKLLAMETSTMEEFNHQLHQSL